MNALHRDTKKHGTNDTTKTKRGAGAPAPRPEGQNLKRLSVILALKSVQNGHLTTTRGAPTPPNTHQNNFSIQLTTAEGVAQSGLDLPGGPGIRLSEGLHAQ